MTVEEVFYDFNKQFGDEFNWHMLPLSNKTFVAELKKEIGKDHVLSDKQIWAVAKCDSNDDVLYLVDFGDGTDIYYIFHLTYAEENADGFPESKRLEGIMAVKEYIEQLFLTEYRDSRYKITIDGERFSTIEEFYQEIDKLLTKNLSWKTGHNMDAFHDLLRGGFGVHELGEGIDFLWVHAKKSRQDFGYEATEAYWRNILQTCHPSNCEKVMQKIKAAQCMEGETLFDIIVGEILYKEDWYNHTLKFDNEG